MATGITALVSAIAPIGTGLTGGRGDIAAARVTDCPVARATIDAI